MSVIGKKVEVTIDRPMGSAHPEHPDMIYEVNYGFVYGIIGGDGEWQDAYVLGADGAAEKFCGVVAAVIKRADDNEEKWVVVPEGTTISQREIIEKTRFCEKFFRSTVCMDDCECESDSRK